MRNEGKEGKVRAGKRGSMKVNKVKEENKGEWRV